MTSANLSLSDRLNNHKKYIFRTLWTSILAFIVMAVYYIIGVIMMITRTINYARMWKQPLKELLFEKYNAVTKIMGLESLGFVLVAGAAVAFAFQGFSYVFEQKKIDFYLSQPTTRSERLRKNYFNAITTFLIIYLSTQAVALIVAACFGAVNSVVLVSVLLESLRSFVFFFAIYNITVLAILLSGSMPIAMLLMLFLLIVTYVFGYEIREYKSIFYATYSSYSHSTTIASPVYDRLGVWNYLRAMARREGYNMSFEPIRHVYSIIWKRDLDTLIVSIIAYIAVCVTSRFRKAEHAGMSIIFKPFRWFVKIVSCVVISLFAGYMVYYSYDDVWNNRVFLVMFLIMMLSVVVVGAIIETILDVNIRSLVKGKFQTIMALCIVALIFLIYRGDLLGYDNYVPKMSDIASCAILDDDYTFQVYGSYDDDDYMESLTSQNNMYLTDVENVVKLAKSGMAEQKTFVKNLRNGEDNEYSYDTTILYRLKDGREIYRDIRIPVKAEKETLSAIINSEEYIKGYFNVFHDDIIRDFDNMAVESNRSVRYVTIGYDHSTSKLPYEKISDAYRKDLEQHFSFEMAQNTVPLGRIEYDYNGKINNSYVYSSCSLNVFPEYENTIKLLSEYGIYYVPEIDVQYIDSVTVMKYSTDEEDDVEVEYTDKEQIQQIFDSVHSSEFYSRWYNEEDLNDNNYSVRLILPNCMDFSYFTFDAGKVPDFVIKDTK